MDRPTWTLDILLHLESKSLKAFYKRLIPLRSPRRKLFGLLKESSVAWWGQMTSVFGSKRPGSIGTTKSHLVSICNVRPGSPLHLNGMLTHSGWAKALNLQFDDDFLFFLTQKCTKNMKKMPTLAADIMMIARSHSLRFPVDWKPSWKHTKKHFLRHK